MVTGLQMVNLGTRLLDDAGALVTQEKWKGTSPAVGAVSYM